MSTSPPIPLEERLQFFARKSGVSREAIARAAGVTLSSVSLWLSGKSKPTYEKLPLIAEAMGIDLPTLFGPLGDDEPAAAAE